MCCSKWNESCSALGLLTRLSSLTISCFEELSCIAAMTKLTRLQMTCINFRSTLPESLRELRMEDGNMVALPRDLTGLVNLSALEVQGCRSLRDVAMVSALTQLKVLDINRCNRSVNVQFLGSLSLLKLLNLGMLAHEAPRLLQHIESSFPPTYLPDLGHMAHLTKLVIQYFKRVSSLQDSISALSMLQSLQLHACRMIRLPEGLGCLRALTSLTLSCMPMTTLPPCLARLSNMVELRIDHCKALKAFPSIVCCMVGLTGLICICNLFTTAPDALGDLTNLKVLRLQQCYLECVPTSIGKLSKLQHLSLADNPKLRALPSTIVKLSKLQHISLAGNWELCALPSTLGLLCKLSLLDVGGIEGLPRPDSFTCLTRLHQPV
jgi:Leucine-rich repeat (LRR) protein